MLIHVLQLCRWNTSHKETLYQTYSIEVELYLKNKKSPFEPSFGELSYDVRTPSIARWKACGQLFIPHN